MGRVVKLWNRLPEDVMKSPSMEVFKWQLDTHLSGMVLTWMVLLGAGRLD